MTNLVIPHVVTVSNVDFTNVVAVTNADASVGYITGRKMQTIAFGPGALVLVLLVVGMVVAFLWRTFGKKDSPE